MSTEYYGLREPFTALKVEAKAAATAASCS